MSEPKLITSDKEHEDAMRQLNILLDKDELNVQEENKLELLAYLIEKYEEEHFPIGNPDPIEAIKFRMEQMDLSQDDLVPYIGSSSKVSEVLNKKRSLSLKMIRDLHFGLGIPYDSLLGNNDSNENMVTLDWFKFPIAAMYRPKFKKYFFPLVKVQLSRIKEKAEEYLRPLITPYHPIFQNCFRRQNVRMGSSSDEYALVAWIAACCRIADQEKLLQAFNPKHEKELIQALKSVSLLDEGPKLAKEMLKKFGIHLVIIPHLPRTHLDGISCIGSDGNPIIGMTLRYDRLDNFWFTLYHELAHVLLHLQGSDSNEAFVDDLKYRANNDKESDADAFASTTLIDDKLLEEDNMFEDYSAERVLEFANKHSIHPSIVAGRIRHHLNNYRILWNLVGNGQVQEQLF
ncbi:MAG: ImmA/IrrE family metallo-endopeptidase [Candidatus Cloacimonetes bacterium]|nr:ImmA/IrrE family metallo-endopeptidase [Candidatus Cloacimonadota bacterium]